MTFNFDPTVVTAILGLFGIGLVYVINLLKNLLKLQDKPAVLLVLAVSAAATAVTLLVAKGFALLPFIIYTAAVFGEMTTWFKLTKKPA
jgi:hypothetical protein